MQIPPKAVLTFLNLLFLLGCGNPNNGRKMTTEISLLKLKLIGHGEIDLIKSDKESLYNEALFVINNSNSFSGHPKVPGEFFLSIPEKDGSTRELEICGLGVIYDKKSNRYFEFPFFYQLIKKLSSSNTHSGEVLRDSGYQWEDSSVKPN